MRIALLSAVKPASTGELRAELHFAGRSVLDWQADLALHVGCERVLVLCHDNRDSVISLQKRIEAKGGQFHLVRSNTQIAALVKAEDELVLLADGLFLERAASIQILSQESRLREMIITLPASHEYAERYPEDFQRIDREHHWAGVAAMRARVVHKMAEMPPDSDPISILLRLALQARVECHDWNDVGLGHDQVWLANDPMQLRGREHAAVESALPLGSGWAPLNVLAALISRRVGMKALASGPEILAGIAFLLLLSANATALADWSAAALAAAAFGCFGARVALNWASLRRSVWRKRAGRFLEGLISSGIDFLSMTCLVLVFASKGYVFWSLALPILAIGLAHLLPGDKPTGTIAFWQDRVLHFIGFAVATATGFLGEAVALYALLALLHIFWRSRTVLG